MRATGAAYAGHLCLPLMVWGSVAACKRSELAPPSHLLGDLSVAAFDRGRHPAVEFDGGGINQEASALVQRLLYAREGFGPPPGYWEIIGRGPTVIPLLSKAFDSTSDPMARKRIISVIAGIGSPEGYPVVKAALQTGDQRLVRQAAFALGEIRSPSSYADLLLLLHAADREIRYSAIFGLAELGDRRAIPHLEQIAKEPIVAVHLGPIVNPPTSRLINPLAKPRPAPTLQSAAAAAIDRILRQAAVGTEPR